MSKTMTTADAVRAFSDILNSVRYHHESCTILQGWKPSAALVPVETIPVEKTSGDLPEFVRNRPRLGDDLERFMSDDEDAPRCSG